MANLAPPMTDFLMVASHNALGETADKMSNRVARREAFTSEYIERQSEIPLDTRTLSQKLCGDPLPGRSALDRKNPE